MDLFKNNENGEKYITFPKTLDTYKWYKPILIFIIGFIIYNVLLGILVVISGIFLPGVNIIKMGNPTPYTYEGILGELVVALMIPSLYISIKLFYKIPFSKQVSPIRSWNLGIYFKTILLAACVYIAYTVVEALILGQTINNHFTIITLLLCIIVTPFQCFAEEYLFRGFLMQTLGSWLKNPIIVIILQGICFSILHFQYNALGLISVLFLGLAYGCLAWYSAGLEITSALHAVNNLIVFIIVGLGLETGNSKGDINSIIVVIVINLIIIALIIFFDKKYGWFGLNRC